MFGRKRLWKQVLYVPKSLVLDRNVELHKVRAMSALKLAIILHDYENVFVQLEDEKVQFVQTILDGYKMEAREPVKISTDAFSKLGKKKVKNYLKYNGFWRLFRFVTEYDIVYIHTHDEIRIFELK